jgi:hypothetical protein
VQFFPADLAAVALLVVPVIGCGVCIAVDADGSVYRPAMDRPGLAEEYAAVIKSDRSECHGD